MNVLLKYNNGSTIEQPYPTDIDKPVPGLNTIKIDGKLEDLPKDSPDYIKIYWINEIYPVIENPNQSIISGEFEYEFTKENHKEYDHFKIVNKIYKKIDFQQEQVIENLNNAYGNYLDTQYPQVERLNHTIELLNGTEPEREKYIKTLQDWLLKCKEDRKNRITDYKEKSIFPSFENFIVKP
jgi:hypothetical protein